MGSSHFLFLHLPLMPRFACHSHVTSLGEIAHRLLRLSICERWLHRHHNSSLNSKCTRTPNSICEVLTSPIAFDIWAKADKIAPTPVLSKTRHFQSLLARYISNYRKKSLFF